MEGTKTMKCPLCHSDKMAEKIDSYLWGAFTFQSLVCPDCHAVFKARGEKWLLASADNSNPLWFEYGEDILTAPEWNTIEQGGMSDAKQREADLNKYFNELRSGKVEVKLIQTAPPVILKKGEQAYCAIPSVELKESRAVRLTHGGYAGPSIRIAKGVSFRLGKFASSSESHQEMRNIDKGILTLTNQRVVFSGGFKTINVSLDKIISIDPFSDGISLHKEGREKTQYFLWPQGMISMKFAVGGRQYTEAFSGLVFQFIVEGLRNTN